MTLSLASSNSTCVTMRLLRRAAIKAASLTRFMRSAPEKPGVPRAVVFRLTSGASVPAHCIDFVDEDDAGGVLLGLLEHVAHARGTHADEHLDEVRAGYGEERHVGLAGNRAREQGLAGSGWTNQQHAARNAPAK